MPEELTRAWLKGQNANAGMNNIQQQMLISKAIFIDNSLKHQTLSQGPTQSREGFSH